MAAKANRISLAARDSINKRTNESKINNEGCAIKLFKS
jgi:hypothetical protein